MIVVASESGRLRRRWCHALETGVTLAEAAEQATLELEMATFKPAILLLDTALLKLNVAEGISHLHRLSPPTKIILLSKRAPRRIAEREALFALREGARGYCDAQVKPSVLRRAVERVQAGEIWIGRRVICALLKELCATIDRRQKELPRLVDRPTENSGVSNDGRLDGLTTRERQVAQLLRSGYSNKEIATQLSLAEKTIKSHLTSIFRKLGLASRLQVALFVSEPAHPRVRSSTLRPMFHLAPGADAARVAPARRHASPAASLITTPFTSGIRLRQPLPQPLKVTS